MDLTYRQVNIANAASVSAAMDLRAERIVAIVMPPAWTAAAITFLAAAPLDNVPGAPTAQPFQKVCDSTGAEVSITAVQGTYVVLTQAQRQSLAGLYRAQLQSGTSGTPVAQGQAVTLYLVVEGRESNT